jgi:hypothetical protein
MPKNETPMFTDQNPLSSLWRVTVTGKAVPWLCRLKTPYQSPITN